MAKVKGGQAVIECLKAVGVEYVFGIAGSATIPLLDLVNRTPGIEYISVRHEQIAAHMADGYARYSGRPGVLFVTRAAGAANTVLGVVTAYSSDSPVMVISGDTSVEDLGKGALQEFDLVTLFKPITKFSYRVECASKIPYMMQKAIRLALSGRPGPVFLSIPGNLMSEKIEMDLEQKEQFYRIQMAQPNPEMIEEAAKMILEAENPAILAGNGVLISGSTDELTELAEKAAIPVIPGWGLLDVMATDHLLFFQDPGVLPEPDLLLAVGSNVADISVWPKMSEGARVIQIEMDADLIGKVYSPDLSSVSDLKTSLRLLSKLIEERMSEEVGDRVKERYGRLSQVKTAFLSERWPKAEWDATPIRPWRLIRDLREALNKETIITHDSGSFSTSWIRRCMDFYLPKTCHCCLGGVMGFALPGALGIKLADPEKDVVAVVGDGSFMMVSSALTSSVQYNIPITVVINNNSAYMQIKWRQKPPYVGSDLLNPDFVKLAEAFGIPGRRVTEPKDIKPALEWAIGENREGRTVLVDVVTTNEPRYANPQMYFRWLEEGKGS